jgi:hypothetical protein
LHTLLETSSIIIQSQFFALSEQGASSTMTRSQTFCDLPAKESKKRKKEILSLGLGPARPLKP